MNSFEALHPRAGGSGPARTQFATRLHQETGLELAAPTLQLPSPGYRGAHSGLPDAPDLAWGTFGSDTSLDHAVQTVMDGPLSRGVTRRESREALEAWHDYAVSVPGPEAEEFAAGIRSGVLALYDRQITWFNPERDRFDLASGAQPGEMDSVLAVYAGTKRASSEDREHWRLLLQQAPSEAWHRGHLAAGIILSGADEYWGMRQDPMGTVTGK